jgi:hypothetical protein
MIIIIIVAAVGFAVYYFYNQSSLYLETDNAQVGGQEISIVAPVAGKLVSWSGTVGTKWKYNAKHYDTHPAKWNHSTK